MLSTLRAWESLSDATCCMSLVIVYNGICILQAGFADVSRSNGGEPVVVDTDKLTKGSLYSGIFKSGSRVILLFNFIGFSLCGNFEIESNICFHLYFQRVTWPTYLCIQENLSFHFYPQPLRYLFQLLSLRETRKRHVF